MCDFGFAWNLNSENQHYTDYVSTWWYWAPELLVGDWEYGKAIDVWAIGCLFVEILTGEPLFPGDSDVQTLYIILQIMGDQLTEKQKQLILDNPRFKNVKMPSKEHLIDLDSRLCNIHPLAYDLIKRCLAIDPDER